MATAERVKNTPPPVEPLPDTIRLELTLEEAGLLRSLYHHNVGGVGRSRAALERIHDALGDADVRIGGRVFRGRVDDIETLPFLTGD